MDAFAEAVRNIKNFIVGVKNLISDVLPDFVKKGFSAAVEYVGGIGSECDQASQSHLAVMDPGGIPNKKTEPDRFRCWVENAVLAYCWNSGKYSQYYYLI